MNVSGREHPELGDGEMFLTNIDPEREDDDGRTDWQSIGYETKREGFVAYDTSGRIIHNMRPVFVKKSEFEKRFVKRVRHQAVSIQWPTERQMAKRGCRPYVQFDLNDQVWRVHFKLPFEHREERPSTLIVRSQGEPKEMFMQTGTTRIHVHITCKRVIPTSFEDTNSVSYSIGLGTRVSHAEPIMRHPSKPVHRATFVEALSAQHPGTY